MIDNESMFELFLPGVENPTKSRPRI